MLELIYIWCWTVNSWVPLYPNMLWSEFPLYSKSLETHLLSLQCCRLIQNSVIGLYIIRKNFNLVLNRRHLYYFLLCHLPPPGGTRNEKGDFDQMIRGGFSSFCSPLKKYIFFPCCCALFSVNVVVLRIDFNFSKKQQFLFQKKKLLNLFFRVQYEQMKQEMTGFIFLFWLPTVSFWEKLISSYARWCCILCLWQHKQTDDDDSSTIEWSVNLVQMIKTRMHCLAGKGTKNVIGKNSFMRGPSLDTVKNWKKLARDNKTFVYLTLTGCQLSNASVRGVNIDAFCSFAIKRTAGFCKYRAGNCMQGFVSDEFLPTEFHIWLGGPTRGQQGKENHTK